MSELNSVEQKEVKNRFIPKPIPISKEVQIPTDKEGQSLLIKQISKHNSDEFFEYYQVAEAYSHIALDDSLRNIASLVSSKENSTDDLFNNLFFISQLRQHSTNSLVADRLASLPNLTTYISELIPDVDKNLMTKIIEDISRFQQIVLTDYKFRRCNPDTSLYSFLSDEEVSWEYIPSELSGGYIADKKVLALAQEYKKTPNILTLISDSEKREFSKRKLVHDTTSSALPGINEVGTIMSAASLIRSGKELSTGEFIEGWRSESGLENVHASLSGVSSGNAEVHFFDEFVVSFIIDEELQAHYMEAELLNKNASSEEAGQIVDRKLRRLPRFEAINPDKLSSMSRDEIKALVQKKKDELKTTDWARTPASYESFLGSTVPLENVVALLVPDEHLQKLAKWGENKLNPSAIKLVREAAEIATSSFVHI